MKKDVSMFSKEELDMLNMFVKQAAIEDKRIHGIPNNNTSTKKPAGGFYNQDKSKTFAGNSNKTNQILNQKKEENKQPSQQLKKPRKKNIFFCPIFPPSYGYRYHRY